jgi:hypothetical protein
VPGHCVCSRASGSFRCLQSERALRRQLPAGRRRGCCGAVAALPLAASGWSRSADACGGAAHARARQYVHRLFVALQRGAYVEVHCASVMHWTQPKVCTLQVFANELFAAHCASVLHSTHLLVCVLQAG